jgi:hypothetical protein
MLSRAPLLHCRSIGFMSIAICCCKAVRLVCLKRSLVGRHGRIVGSGNDLRIAGRGFGLRRGTGNNDKRGEDCAEHVSLASAGSPGCSVTRFILAERSNGSSFPCIRSSHPPGIAFSAARTYGLAAGRSFQSDEKRRDVLQPTALIRISRGGEGTASSTMMTSTKETIRMLFISRLTARNKSPPGAATCERRTRLPSTPVCLWTAGSPCRNTQRTAEIAWSNRGRSV